jgi:hypothetical protein
LQAATEGIVSAIAESKKACIETLATSTNLSIPADSDRNRGRASRGFIGEITKRTRAALPMTL